MPINRTELFSTPKWFNKAESITEIVNMTADGVRSAASFVEEIGVVTPNGINRGIQATAFLGAGSAIFAIPNFIKNIHKAIVSNTVVQKIIHIARAILSAGTLVEDFTFCIDGLKAVGAIAKETLSWTTTILKVLYPLQFLSLALGFYDTKEIATTRREMKQKITISKKLSFEKRVENLTSASTYVLKNVELRKSLAIHKKAQIDERLESIFKRTFSESVEERQKAVVEGEQLLKGLKRRVNTQLALNVLSQAAKIVTIVIVGFLLFTTPTAALFALAVSITVVALTLFATEKILVNKDPFSQPRDVWYDKALYRIRQWIYGATHCLYAVFKNGTRSLGK